MKPTNNERRINFAITEELHRSFKSHCAAHGLDMKTVITKLITQAVSSPKKGTKR